MNLFRNRKRIFTVKFFLLIIFSSVFLQAFSSVVSAQKQHFSDEGKKREKGVFLQPVKNRGSWNWVAPINGSGYCGPASIYQIVYYYGDFGKFERKEKSGKNWHDTPLEIRPIRGTSTRFVDDSDFAKFIQRYSTGSSWKMMKKVAGLYRTRNSDDPLYHVCLCSDSTKYENVQTRRERLDQLREQILNRGVPVVIHLDGVSMLPGHYMTLIGDDIESSVVFLVDSLKPEKGILSISREAFLSEWFYVSGSAYKARWDGTWMAFWHPGKIRITDIECAEFSHGSDRSSSARPSKKNIRSK